MSRVSRVLFAGVMIAACGARGPAPLSGPLPVALAPEPVATPAPVTCADAGVLLARTYAAYDDAMEQKHEGEIAKACTAGTWAQPVLDCIGSTISGSEKCVEQLTHEQQVALIGSVTQATPPKEPEPPEDDTKFTPCEVAIAAPAAFGEPLTITGDDLAFAVALRQHRLVDTCNEDSWPEKAKACFASALDGASIMKCVGKLPDRAQTGAITAAVAAQGLADKTFAARKVAANIACPKVVGKHYGEAAWKDKLSKVKPADRKAAIASSRARMTKACTTDKWPATVRACVLVGGDFPECTMHASGVDPWGYPAFGVVVPTGVPACDKYIAAIAKLAECPGAKDMRDGLLQAVSTATSTMSELPEESRKVIAEVCVQGMESVNSQAKELGCKP